MTWPDMATRWHVNDMALDHICKAKKTKNVNRIFDLSKIEQLPRALFTCVMSRILLHLSSSPKTKRHCACSVPEKVSFAFRPLFGNCPKASNQERFGEKFIFGMWNGPLGGCIRDPGWVGCQDPPGPTVACRGKCHRGASNRPGAPLCPSMSILFKNIPQTQNLWF